MHRCECRSMHVAVAWRRSMAYTVRLLTCLGLIGCKRLPDIPGLLIQHGHNKCVPNNARSMPL